MKHLIYTLAFLFVSVASVNAQQITFDNEVVDYGNIKKGDDGERSFSFTNTGNQPLIIKSVKPSCGCTVADYPKAPVAPGESGKIAVGYNTDIVSAFNKTITVYSNDVDAERKVIRIKGVVKE